MSVPSGITLTATGISCNAVQLTWTDGTNTCDYYSVYRTAATGLSFNASISGTTMTVNQMLQGSEGEISVGTVIQGTGVTTGTTVTALGTGTGGVGTYTVSESQDVSSEAMWGSTTYWIGNVYLDENVSNQSQDNNGWNAVTQEWNFNDDETQGSTEYTWTVEAIGDDGSILYEATSASLTTISCFSEQNFNCDCQSWPNDAFETLATLRGWMMNRLGFAAVSANPPPGMTPLINGFLQDAQKQLWKNHKELHTERFFSWTMVPGERFYGISDDNAECSGQPLDPYKVTWVGFQDLNLAWYTLVEGIDPVLYTRATITLGWPTRYEIRSCIEIFPAPRASYTLWVKGHFGLQPFAADTDTTTIDSHGVFLLALANAKAHYGQPDAANVLQQATNYMERIVAGAHGTRRYVPRTRIEEPMTPPRFLPLHGAAA